MLDKIIKDILQNLTKLTKIEIYDTTNITKNKLQQILKHK